MQVDYVRQVQTEMVDDMLEEAIPGKWDEDKQEWAVEPYKRGPFAGEGGVHYAEDQPPLDDDVSEEAKNTVLILVFASVFFAWRLCLRCF